MTSTGDISSHRSNGTTCTADDDSFSCCGCLVNLIKLYSPSKFCGSVGSRSWAFGRKRIKSLIALPFMHPNANATPSDTPPDEILVIRISALLFQVHLGDPTCPVFFTTTRMSRKRANFSTSAISLAFFAFKTYSGKFPWVQAVSGSSEGGHVFPANGYQTAPYRQLCDLSLPTCIPQSFNSAWIILSKIPRSVHGSDCGTTLCGVYTANISANRPGRTIFNQVSADLLGKGCPF